jgi:hypothetical protein
MNKPNMLTHDLNYILLLNYELERPRENHWQDNFGTRNLCNRKVGCMSSTQKSLLYFVSSLLWLFPVAIKGIACAVPVLFYKSQNLNSEYTKLK